MLSLLEVTPISLAYICLGGFIVTFSVFSLLVREKVYVNEVVLGTGFGILMGPLCAGVFDPRSWSQDTNRITLEVMRVVLATGLFAIGVELPESYMWRHVKGLVALIVPTMAIGWFIVAGLMKALFSRFSFITCLALAACLTPTDPIISAAIIGGKFARQHVPLNLRQILSAESAANDGLAYPFLSISLYLTLESDYRKIISDWVLIGWLYQVILGTFIGAVIGYIFSHIMKFSHRRGFINRESYVSQYLALAIFTMGVVNTVGSDDLLAAFAAGCAVSWDGDFNAHTEGEAFASVIEYILNCGCFFYIGAWLPWKDFTIPDLGINPWKLVVLCIGILFLRRIPAILVLYKWVPEISSWKEALFCGHFGPMGVGAIFISTLALHRLPEARNPVETQQDILATALHPIVGFVVLVSIIIHGLSIPFFSAGKNIHSRTFTSSSTFYTRSKTPSPAQDPEWVLSVRHAPTDPTLPLHHPVQVATGQVPPSATTQDEKNTSVRNHKAGTGEVLPMAIGMPPSTEKVMLPSTSPTAVNGNGKKTVAFDTAKHAKSSLVVGGVAETVSDSSLKGISGSDSHAPPAQ